jgi:hypothetical protein
VKDDRGVVRPAIGRQLTGDDRGARAVAILEDLPQVLTLAVFESDEAPIIEDEDIDARETRQHNGVRAVAMRERQFGNRRGRRR